MFCFFLSLLSLNSNALNLQIFVIKCCINLVIGFSNVYIFLSFEKIINEIRLFRFKQKLNLSILKDIIKFANILQLYLEI